MNRAWMISLVVLASTTMAEGVAIATEPPPIACSLTADGPIDFVVSGAFESAVKIKTDCAYVGETPVRLDSHNTGLQIHGTLVPIEGTKGFWLKFSSIPKTEDTTAEWAVTPPPPASGAKTFSATLHLKIITITASDVLAVNYEDNDALNLKHSRLSEKATDGPIAVVSPNDAGKALVQIANTAQIAAPFDLASARDNKYQWVIDHSTWGWGVWFQCDGLPPSPAHPLVIPAKSVSGRQWNHQWCTISFGDRIRFIVSRAMQTPLVVTMSLRLEDVVITRVSLTLASTSRPESLPVPLNEIASISCDSPGNFVHLRLKARDHGVVAIDHDALQKGECRLIVDFGRLRGDESSEVYGAQGLAITVARGDGTGGKTMNVVVNPQEGDTSTFTLRADAPPDSEPAVYKVTVKLQPQGQVVYRAGSLTPSEAGDFDDEHVFEATLRTRGTSGFLARVRTYITFPVIPFAIRIPARPRDLEKSSDPIWFDTETLRAGIAIVVEPWSYEDSRNLSPIPLSLRGGLTFLKLTAETTRPTAFLGISLDYPLEGTKIAKALSLGIFYEVDLGDEHPFSTGAVLITSSINLLQFGGESGK